VRTAGSPLGSGAVLLAAITLAACGGSDSSSDATSTSGGTLSPADYEKALKSTCKQAKATVQALPPFPFPNIDTKHPDPAQLPAIGRYFEQNTLKAYAVIIAGFESLQPPAGEKAALDALITRLKAQVVVAHRQIEAAKKTDVAGFVATFDQIDASVTKLKAAQSALGVPVCTDIV
jgi:hypothetical protein